MVVSSSKVGQSDGIYDKKLKAVSPKKVVIKAFEKNREHIVGGIFIREEVYQNCRLNRYEIVSMGKEAKLTTGLTEGDIVFGDALARYYDTFPVSVMNYDSIIFKENQETLEIEPLKGMIFVEPDKVHEDNRQGIVVVTDLLPTGTITKINSDGYDYCDFKVGDKVLLTSNNDVVIFKNKKFHIYKIPLVDAIVENE